MIPIRRYLRRISYTILPMDCTGCGTPLQDDPIPFFCELCWQTITPLSAPMCPRCSLPFSSPITLRQSPTHLCGTCRTQPPAFTRASTPYPYEAHLKKAICQFKYHGKINLARPLANLMATGLNLPPNLDSMIPVPLHPDRLRQREYNQALLLADQLATHLHLPVQRQILIRIRPNAPQTSLKRSDRLKNLRRSFSVTSPSMITGKSILLIDDVFTTGATVNECAKALRKAGAGDIYVGTIARMV